MADCYHPEFEAFVAVHRMVDRYPDRPWSHYPDDCESDGPCDRYAADIKIRCKVCKVPFVFKGLPAGLAMDHPTVSAIYADEARMPIEPEADAPYWGQSEEVGHG